MITAAGKLRHGAAACLLSCASLLCSQEKVQPDYEFANHLTAQLQHRQATALLHFDRGRYGKDTSDFLLGYNHHFLKNTDSAAHFLSRVPASSAFFRNAAAYGALNHLYSKNFQGARNSLSPAFEGAGKEEEQVLLMLSAAETLLRRNYAGFDSIAVRFRYGAFTYQEEQRTLTDIRARLKAQKKKSPAVAGLLSAAVPGLGKFYAGKKGAALSAFFTNIVLAGFAAESYYRSGYRSPQFITFATVFACFYTGNIVGSVYSVKLHQRSVYGKINNEILATVHIPVNRVFGR
jgi:hypothetical protein